MNNLTDHDWEYSGIDGAIKNEWYIIPLTVIGTFLAVTAFVGVEDMFNVLAQFIGAVVTN